MGNFNIPSSAFDRTRRKNNMCKQYIEVSSIIHDYVQNSFLQTKNPPYLPKIMEHLPKLVTFCGIIRTA